MSDTVKDAIAKAVERLGLTIDASLLEAIVEIQERHQYDQEDDRRIQEMESLLNAWCDSHGGGDDAH